MIDYKKLYKRLTKTTIRGPYLFWVPFSSGFWVYSFLVHDLSFALRLLAFVFGLINWTLLEYGLHRHFFHWAGENRILKTLVYAIHISHHENPKNRDKLTAPLIMAVPFACVDLGLLTLLFGWPLAVNIFPGMIAGYLFYEWCHYTAHYRNPKSQIARTLKSYHLYHHYKNSEEQYGVTQPLWDFVFGTFRRKKAPAALAPAKTRLPA